MAKQEFYESWRSKILEIPGLPLEGETAASQNQSIIDGSMIPLPFKPQGDRKTNEAGNIDIHRPGHMSPFNRPGSARGHITPTPRENSLTVSIMEEEDDLLREKFKNVMKEEQTKNKKLRFDLGIPSQIIEENLGGASSNLDHSNKQLSRPPYELFKVSDIFKSGFVGRGYDKRKAVSNLFKYRRGASVISPNKCQLYTPNEGVSRFQEPTEFLKCINCGLSMNSHQYLKFKVAFNNKALEYLRGLLFYQEMINDSDVVILIGTGLGSNTLNQESRENTLNMFLQQLSTCGLKVKDIARMNGRDMKIKLYSKYLILNCPLDEKDKFEDYIEHPEMEEDLRGGMRLTTVSFDDLRS
jgi:hypothetical protein